MVDKPADVLPMANASVPWHLRLDNALRKTPGLGIFVTVALLIWTWEQSWIFGATYTVLVASAVIGEFLPTPRDK